MNDGICFRYTPIHRACSGSEKHHTEAVRALLEAGVPVDQMTPTGLRPIDIVKDNEGTKTLLKEWAEKVKKEKKDKKERKEREKREKKEREEKERAEKPGQDGEL